MNTWIFQYQNKVQNLIFLLGAREWLSNAIHALKQAMDIGLNGEA